MKAPGPLTAVILWTILVAVLLLAPGNAVSSRSLNLPDWSDKVVHALLFFGEAYFLLRWLTAEGQQRSRLVAAALACGLAVSTEAAQLWVPNRGADPADLAANVLGIFLVLVITWRREPLDSQ